MPDGRWAMLADDDHPAIQSLAQELTADRLALRGKLASLFQFVRDDIRFGFPPRWDEVRASETLAYGVGYCNTKATLFLALCKAADIGARLRTGLISLEIMRGIFPAFAFPYLPREGAHAWLEVELEGAWKPIDAYINDRRFYDGALKRLQDSGRMTGFSVSRARGPCSCEFNFGEKGFVHMGAVVEDHGAWPDFSEYMASPAYRPMSAVQRMAYPGLARMVNRTIESIRRAA
jgi:hypothetical protein